MELSSASRRRVQRFRPGGAGEQAKATRRACRNAPSKITFRGPPPGSPAGCAPRRTPNPAPQTRRFKCSIVRAETPSASATRAIGPSHGPSGPAVAQQLPECEMRTGTACGGEMVAAQVINSEARLPAQRDATSISRGAMRTQLLPSQSAASHHSIPITGANVIGDY